MPIFRRENKNLKKLGHLADSLGEVWDSRSWGLKFETHVGCRAYLEKKSLKKRDVIDDAWDLLQNNWREGRWSKERWNKIGHGLVIVEAG